MISGNREKNIPKAKKAARAHGISKTFEKLTIPSTSLA